MPLLVSNENWYEPSGLTSWSWRKICALISFKSDRSTTGRALNGCETMSGRGWACWNVDWNGRGAGSGCDARALGWAPNRGAVTAAVIGDDAGRGGGRGCGASVFGWPPNRSAGAVAVFGSDAGRGSGRTLAFLPNGFTPNGTSANSFVPPIIIGVLGNSDTSALTAAMSANASMMALLTFWTRIEQNIWVSNKNIPSNRWRNLHIVISRKCK